MPPRIAFGLTNLLEDALLASAGSTPPDFPMSNMLDERPGVVAAWAEGDQGLFEFNKNNGRYIDIDEGGGEVRVDVGGPTSSVSTRWDYAVTLQAALNAAGGLAHTYTCFWNADQRLRIGATGTFSILWSTGTDSANNIGAETGFDTSGDDPLIGPAQTVYIADQRRYSTTIVVRFDITTATRFYMLPVFLEGDDDTDYGDGSYSGVSSALKIYGHSAAIGLVPALIKALASVEIEISPRGGYDEVNPIQMGVQASPSNYRYYYLVWKHYDESNVHRVGFVGGMASTGSSTRTVIELAGHRMVEESEPIGSSNYYPVPHLKRWRLPLAFDRWGGTDYRNVIHEVVRHGKTKPMVVAVRYSGDDGVEDGTLTAEDEADIGLLLWGAVVEYNGDNYGGEGSEALSGELVIEQVR